MYYKNFGKVNYLLTPPSYQQPPVYTTLVDITTNVRFIQKYMDDIVLYDYYKVQDGDTWEIISEKLYDSPHYNWILMLLNNRFNYTTCFPKDFLTFDNYIIDKYGSVEAAQEKILYYQEEDGVIRESNTYIDIDSLEEVEIANLTAVSAYDRELTFNEYKREIKVISRELLTVVLSQFRKLLKNG